MTVKRSLQQKLFDAIKSVRQMNVLHERDTVTDIPVPKQLHRNLLTVLLGFLFLHLMTSNARSQTSQLPEGWSASQDGSNTIYKPANLPDGNTFSMTVFPTEDLRGRDLPSWFSQRVQADLQQRGVPAKLTPPQRSPSGLVSETLQFHDKSGQVWTLIYAAAQSPDGPAHFCAMISNLRQSSLAPNITAAGNIFGQRLALARTGGATPPSNGAATNRSSDAAEQPRSAAGNGSGIRASQSGARISDAEIEAVLHGGYGTTTVYGYQYVESVSLLLKDGWEYSDLTVPPEDLDAEASKRSEPQKWHHWREQGGHYFIQETNGAWTQLQADRVRPLESGSSLNKSLMHRDAKSFGGMGATVTTKTIALLPTGRFERSSGFIGGTGTVQSAGGFSSGAASYSDRSGSRSAASGTYSGSDSSVTARSARSGEGDGSATGTYHVSGYALELDSANGQRQRFLAFYSSEGKHDVYIGTVTFSVGR